MGILELRYNLTMPVNFQIRGDSDNPYHLSVGAVILKINEVTLLKKKDGSYTLPRETMYLQESIEESLVRGMQEEIGIIIKIGKYLGSQTTYFTRPDNTNVEKTTIYFTVTKLNDIIKKQEFDELGDKIIAIDIRKAIELLKNQNNEEYKILQRVAGNKSSD